MPAFRFLVPPRRTIVAGGFNRRIAARIATALRLAVERFMSAFLRRRASDVPVAAVPNPQSAFGRISTPIRARARQGEQLRQRSRSRTAESYLCLQSGPRI